MLYIIIPVHNRINFTKNCILALRRQTEQNFNIIVVDDGSTDGTSEMLKKDFPEIEIIMGSGQLYWTASINLGIKKALSMEATMVMTLNNDTIPSDTFIENMIKHAVNNPNGIIGAVEIDFESHEISYGGEVFKNSNRNKIVNLMELLNTGQKKGLHEVAHLPGRGLLIPKNVIKNIGLLDQKRFPHYYADYDYTRKAVLNNIKVYINYDAKLYTFPKESGNIQNRTKKSFITYYKHLFHIKGGGNLLYFTRFTLKNIPFQFIPFTLLKGYLFRILGFWIK